MDSGAVAKPLVFESSAKRAAAVRDPHASGGAGEADRGAAAPPPRNATNDSAGPALPAAGSGGEATATAAPAAAMRAQGAAGMAGAPAVQSPEGGSGASAATTTPATVSESGVAHSEAATPCTMTVSYTAVGMHGMWYPHNIGAVWVEDTQGKFIKTLERWAGIRAGYLANWNMREDQHGQWPSCPFANVCTGPMVPDQVDVKSQATIFEDNAMHMATWTCKDLNGEVVPDGTYKLFFEEMENIYPAFPAGPLGTVEFEKGPSAATFTPEDQAPFKDLTIVYEPTAG